MFHPLNEVISTGLCTGCGTCAGICPNVAIKMKKNSPKGVYLPQIDGKKCNNCGLCSEVCPGSSVNIKKLALELFKSASGNLLTGNVINYYTGHATNPKLRHDAASGGLLTALLIFALKQGIIDGALVTKMNELSPLEPLTFLAKSEKELISASKSKYCPVPVNESLRSLMKEQGTFAVVGLPCHIHGIRKSQQVIKVLQNKIAFCFGLACAHTPTFHATEYILLKLGINKADVAFIEYRGNGWPGSMTIKLKNGEYVRVPYRSRVYWGRTFCTYFWPMRCSLCDDRANQLADATFMDAWSQEGKDNVGTSLIMSRRPSVNELILKAIGSRQIDVSKGQLDLHSREVFYFSKREFAARYSLCQILGREVPIYNQDSLSPNLKNYFNSIIFYLRNLKSEKDYFWRTI